MKNTSFMKNDYKVGIVNIDQVIRKINPYYKEIFICACIFGILAHGFMLSQKISYHDDIVCTANGLLGATFESGRWLLGLVQYFLRNFWGNYNSSYLGGILTIFLFAISTVMLTGLLNLSKKASILSAGILMVYPYMISTFAYLFQGFAHGFALVLILIAVFLMTRERINIIFCCISSLLIACAMGIYQSFLCWGIALLCFCTLLMIGKEKIKQILIRGVERIKVLPLSRTFLI